MHVHIPKLPHSFQEFLAEIGTITVGILIALGLEAGVGAWHDRKLVDQARTNVRQELTANRSGLVAVLGSERNAIGGLARLVEHDGPRQSGGSGDEPNIAINIEFREMRTAAWESTVATQALTHMPYQDAQAFALAYSGSRTFNGLQEEARKPWIEMSASFGGALKDMSEGQFRDAQRAAILNRTYATTILATGQDLLKIYDRALKHLD